MYFSSIFIQCKLKLKLVVTLLLKSYICWIKLHKNFLKLQEMYIFELESKFEWRMKTLVLMSFYHNAFDMSKKKRIFVQKFNPVSIGWFFYCYKIHVWCMYAEFTFYENISKLQYAFVKEIPGFRPCVNLISARPVAESK